MRRLLLVLLVSFPAQARADRVCYPTGNEHWCCYYDDGESRAHLHRCWIWVDR